MPKTSRKKCAWKSLPYLPKSQTLRVIRYHDGRISVPAPCVTNVLNPKTISREDWVRMATADEAGRVLEAGLYHRCWEIETMFCELKVRQGMQRSLRSRTAEGVAFEVAGHVLLYFLTRWLIFEAAEEHGVSPLRISFTQALRGNQRYTSRVAAGRSATGSSNSSAAIVAANCPAFSSAPSRSSLSASRRPLPKRQVSPNS